MIINMTALSIVWERILPAISPPHSRYYFFPFIHLPFSLYLVEPQDVTTNTCHVSIYYVPIPVAQDMWVYPQRLQCRKQPMYT